jgi:hypothetical protein
MPKTDAQTLIRFLSNPSPLTWTQERYSFQSLFVALKNQLIQSVFGKKIESELTRDYAVVTTSEMLSERNRYGILQRDPNFDQVKDDFVQQAVSGPLGLYSGEAIHFSPSTALVTSKTNLKSLRRAIVNLLDLVRGRYAMSQAFKDSEVRDEYSLRVLARFVAPSSFQRMLRYASWKRWQEAYDGRSGTNERIVEALGTISVAPHLHDRLAELAREVEEARRFVLKAVEKVPVGSETELVHLLVRALVEDARKGSRVSEGAVGGWCSIHRLAEIESKTSGEDLETVRKRLYRNKDGLRRLVDNGFAVAEIRKGPGRGGGTEVWRANYPYNSYVRRLAEKLLR